MTDSEAKELMLIEKECINRDCDRDCVNCDIVQKVEDLNNAYDMAIRALEKQIAKKPKKSGVTDKRGIFHPINGIDGVPYDLCPLCEANLCTTGILGRKKMNYCKECGQKLDWSDE